jgi:hypothetical protein
MALSFSGFRASGKPSAVQIASKIAPNGFAHINMRGIISFDLGTAKTALLETKGDQSSTFADQS